MTKEELLIILGEFVNDTIEYPTSDDAGKDLLIYKSYVCGATDFYRTILTHIEKNEK